MEISINDIKGFLEGILKGGYSRDAADRWAASVKQKDETEGLTYFPKEAEDDIWDAICFLHGIDLMDLEFENYITSDDQIREYFENFNSRWN